MKLTKEQISEKIKQLPPIEVEEFAISPILAKRKPLEAAKKISNEEILSHLAYIFNKHETIEFGLTNQSKRNTYNESITAFRKEYYQTPLKALKFSNSSTFFSPRFEKKIKDLLLDVIPEKLSHEELLELNNKLQDLSTIEFEWKEYHRRAVSKELANQQFKEEYKSFSEVFETIRNPESSDLLGQRAETKFLPYKVGGITHALIQILYTKHNFKSLEFCKDFDSTRLGQIVAEHVDSKRVFNDLARISIKKAHEKLLNLRETAQYKEDVLSISKYELYEEFRKSLIVEAFYAVLSYGETSKQLSSDIADSLSREVQAHIFYKGMLVNLESLHKKPFFQFSDLTSSVLEAFTSSNFFSDSITAVVKKNQASVQLILPDHIVVEAYRPFKFPNIIRPRKLKKKDIDQLIKPLINGQGSLTKSDHLVAALNISRSKPFKVNPLFLLLCQEFFYKETAPSTERRPFENWLREGFISIGSLDISSINALYDELENLLNESNSTKLNLYIANSVLNQLSLEKGVSLKGFVSILSSCGMSKAESLRFHAAKMLEKDYVSELIDWKFTQSRLFLAEQLKRFPLYITDILCIRLRMYPREHWLSRTAGSLKHLLCNYKPRKLTQKGYINLLRAYYQANAESLLQFETYLSTRTISKKNGNKLLFNYFMKNPLDFTIIRKPMYFLNLHLALMEAHKNNQHTAINVEIDQNASALAILSLVLRSKEMAKVCNVIGGESKVSPYDYIKEKCAEYLDQEGKELNTSEYADVCEFLRTSRELHKYAIMCFCYNQTTLGRIRDFSDTWLGEFGYLPNKVQRKALNRFATLYPKFVEFVFPNTLRKLDIFKEIITLVCAEAPHIQMRTIDGEVINWAFYATTYQNRKYYDVVERAHKSYKISTYRKRKTSIVSDMGQESENFPENFELDTSGMRKRFLSYLIHSIDASILRRIIYMMKEKHKTSVNHLHDCVILHPNDVEAFYKVVKEIYTSPDLYNIVVNGVFDSVTNTLSPESKEKLNTLKTEYLSLTTDFKSDIKNFNPHHMYSLED